MKSPKQILAYRELDPSQLLAFDIETTGLRPGRDEVLSVAMVDGLGEILLNSYIRPVKHTHWPEAQRVNGITWDDVRNAPTLSELTPAIHKLVAEAALVIGYNCDRYDIPFLEALGVRPDWGDRFDVMTEFAACHGRASRWGGSGRWVKLVDCAQHYRYRFDAHHALDDTRATMWCFRQLVAEDTYLTTSRRFHGEIPW